MTYPLRPLTVATLARLAAVAAAVGAAGCSGGAPRTPAATRPVLLVAAASDLQEVVPELVTALGRGNVRGFEVRPTFRASGILAGQIKAGAPYDVFLSANTALVDDLAAAGAVDPESVRPYAVGTLVLAVNRGSGVRVERLADLTRPGVKAVAIANPDTAPYGAAARQALTRAGLWDALKPKIVPADSVRQAFRYVQSGDAEVGLVGSATAAAPGVDVVEIDRALYDPIVQGLGVVSSSSRKAEAAEFVAFVVSPMGQSVLAGFGFRPPPGPARGGAAGP